MESTDYWLAHNCERRQCRLIFPFVILTSKQDNLALKERADGYRYNVIGHTLLIKLCPRKTIILFEMMIKQCKEKSFHVVYDILSFYLYIQQ